MKRIVILLAAAQAGFGAVGNVVVRGVTSTQAILTYTAPDTARCSVEVSESSTYRPLVHDVNPALFASANLDSRPEGISSGRQRVFVVGKRRAEKALDGHWYSRALQTITPHFYRITCGTSTATGTFETANIALGNAYNEALPPDPDASSQPYFPKVGSYAWPEFINWNKNDPAARKEAVIDPQTGILLKRMGLPMDASIEFLPGTGEHFFRVMRSTDGAWNIPSTVFSIANGKLVRITTGSSNATVTTSSAHGLATNSVVTISGLASGNGMYQITGTASTTFTIGLGSLPANTTLTDDSLAVTAYAGTADNGTAATFTGTKSNVLQLRDETLNTGTGLNAVTLPLAYLTLSIKGWCSGTCAGEDAKIQACLTINGVTCWPTNATAKYQEVALGTSQTSSFVSLGSTVPILDAWTPAGFLPLNRADLAMRSGRASVAADGSMTWVSGIYFNPNWITGSRIQIGESECNVSGSTSTKEMRIDPASCSTPLALPLTSAPFVGNNFGFLIRKKTSSTDTIRLQFAKYNTGSSQHMEWNASGSALLCSPTLIQNTVTKAYGYHCINYANLPMLYWVDRTTGESNYLGLLSASVTGPDGGSCTGNATLRGTTPTAPETFYCSASDNASPPRQGVISCTVNTNNQPGNLSLVCTNITPGSQGRDLTTLITEFTAGSTPTFGPANFGCGFAGAQGSKLLMSCGPGPQDTLKWVVVFDPRKVGTAPGCVGGGKPGCVVAAMPTWATSPARWCTLHTLFVSGDTDVVWVAGKYFTPNTPPQPGDGPYTANITSAALTATPTIPAGTGICPSGGSGCDLVTVDGEPCDPFPTANEVATSPCPKNAAWAYLQDAKVGDYFQVDNEIMRLIAKDGNQWTIQRGAGVSATAGHSSKALSAYCESREFTHGVSNWSYTWDSASDPNGLNPDGTTVRVAYDYDHPVPRSGVTIGGAPYYDPACRTPTCYAVRDGVGSMGDAPNRMVTGSPRFAGTGGPADYIQRAQDHPSRLQDAAPPSEAIWFADGRPLTTLIDISDAAMRISGSLYRMTSTTTDGDTLRRPGYNIYVTRASDTSLLAAGNCSVDNPCPIWNDTQLVDSIKASCTINLTSSGNGTIWVSRLSSGGLGVTRSSGITVTSDNCPVSVGTGYPSGSTQMWAWAVTSGAFASSGTDQRGGSSGSIGTINRKLIPMFAFCGTQPMMDVSSAATGDVVSDTPSDGYKYCVARKAGECRAASQPGDIYMNCPNAGKRPDGSYGCQFAVENADTPVDMCVGNHNAYLNAVVQMGFSKNDSTGALGRSLTKGLNHYKLYDPYFHGKALPDASWMTFRTPWVNGAFSDVLLAKMPPFPPTDTVDRTTFIPLPVKLTPPPGLAVNNVVVQFGYSENGSPDRFYCTSRRETCLATATTVPAVPFVFPSEGTNGDETGVPGLSCTNGCTVAVPALSQRMLYYQVKYRDASNRTLATGQVEVVATP